MRDDPFLSSKRLLSLRRVLVWIALVLALVVLTAQLIHYARDLPFVYGDFIEYWSAGRLCLLGENPYELNQLAVVQRAAGSPKPRALLMHNPPWSLSLVLPFALLDYSLGRLSWTFFLLLGTLVSVGILWHLYEYPIRRLWVAWLVAVSFIPTLFALNIGQISPLILWGLVAFLYLANQERWLWAGAALVLVTLKPQLLLVFWCALTFWVFRREKYSLIWGGFLGLMGMLLIPLLLRQSLIVDYIQATLSHPPKRWFTPTLGAILRFYFGWEKLWLQFLPLLLGLIWWGYLELHRSDDASWLVQFPNLLFISLITTAYGWSHDQIVLLIPVIQVVGLLLSQDDRFPWMLAGGYVLINGLALVVHFLRVGESWFIWMAPAWFLWYHLARRRVRRIGSPTED